jgi:hypothetical protein
MTTEDITEKLKQYFELKKQEAALKTEADLIKEEIVKEMKSINESEYYSDVGRIKIINFEKRLFSQDKAKEILGPEKFSECFIKVSQEQVRITQAEFQKDE